MPGRLSAELPGDLLRELDGRSAVIERVWRSGQRMYLLAACGPDPLFARCSPERRDREVFDHDIRVRGIAASAGVRTPAVLEQGPGWVLEAAIEWRPCSGRVDIDRIVSTAARVEQLELSQGPSFGLVGRGEHRVSRVSRRIRALFLPLPLRDLIQIKRLQKQAEFLIEQSALPMTSSHGDFIAENVLMTDHAAVVIDWEVSGPRPRGYDLMKFWASLQSPADQDRVLEGTLDLVGRQNRDELLRLRYALALNTIAQRLSSIVESNNDLGKALLLLERLPALRREGGL